MALAGGLFVSQVLVLVGLYTLMGLGLNLEVGFAGLLDLGFVAFFAIGAYTVGLLTSTGQYGIAHWSFWAAVPVALVVSLIAGFLFGLPILRIRGDYLAIATLGFGEIIRLLALSDALRPWFGGSQGILAVPKPNIGGFEFSGPMQIFYITLVSSAFIAFVAARLRDSRLGRAWMAMREDEDVAEALGINLINVKLLAYGIGGAFAGMGGAIFAALLGSIFPHSFNLLISINVLALIIVGGMGSLPGVVVGSLFLVGLPELLREFSDFRFLVYGAALIIMMQVKPAGLWPAAAVRRELLKEEPVGAVTEGPVAARAGAQMGIPASQQLTKRFGGLIALSELDLDVAERSIHSIIGPNGAGKTTYFNCVTGFYRAEEGPPFFNGQPIDTLTPDKITQLGIARTYQNIRLFANMTCLENILVGMHPHLKSSWMGAILRTPATRQDEAKAHEEAIRLLQFVGQRGKGDYLARNLP